MSATLHLLCTRKSFRNYAMVNCFFVCICVQRPLKRIAGREGENVLIISMFIILTFKPAWARAEILVDWCFTWSSSCFVPNLYPKLGSCHVTTVHVLAYTLLVLGHESPSTPWPSDRLEVTISLGVAGAPLYALPSAAPVYKSGIWSLSWNPAVLNNV